MEVLGKVDGEHAEKFIKKNMSGEIILFTEKQSL